MEGTMSVFFASFLVFMISNFPAVTAASNSTYQYQMQAKFNMGGIKGAVMFLQKSTAGMLDIKVQFDKLSTTGFWGVFSNPAVFNGNPSDSCSSDIVGPILQDGNLTAKHSRFAYKANYNNDKLQIFGKKSILGASLVLTHPITLAPWGCATILPFDTPVVYATATFKGVASGVIQFLQDSNNSTSEVAIIGELYYTDGRLVPSVNHGWYISSASASDYNKCDQLTTVFTGGIVSSNACSEHQPEACAMGDLSSKLNNISIGIANVAANSKKFRIIDTSLKVSSLFGHALVIRNSAGVPFACANIQKTGPVAMTATFDAAKHDGVSGSVSFSQNSPYHPTVIQYALAGLASKAKGIHVHQFPIPVPEPALPCAASAVGSHLNPYGINNKAANYPADGSGVTLDNYELGDISGKFGNLSDYSSSNQRFVDDQMDLFGRYSNLNRALVIHRNDAAGSRWVCSNIAPANVSKWLSATADFAVSSDLVGTVNFRQYMLADSITTDTAITVQLAYKDASITTNNHNWHVHIASVGSDSKAEIGTRCQSVGGHYNPYVVNATSAGYSSECSPNTPFRCELGDLNGKHAKYNIGGGKKYFVDSNTPLFSAMSVMGRSVTFHTENAGAPRLACADVIPDSITAINKIEHNYPEAVSFDEKTFRDLVVKGFSVQNWQVTYIKSMASAKPCKKVVFYVVDNRAPSNAARFKTEFQTLIKNKQLGDYKLCVPSTKGMSNQMDPSGFTILLSVVLFFMLTWK